MLMYEMIKESCRDEQASLQLDKSVLYMICIHPVSL